MESWGGGSERGLCGSDLPFGRGVCSSAGGGMRKNLKGEKRKGMEEEGVKEMKGQGDTEAGSWWVQEALHQNNNAEDYPVSAHLLHIWDVACRWLEAAPS